MKPKQCLMVAVSLKFKKQIEWANKKLLSEYFRHEWIFQERFGDNDNMCIYTGISMRTSDCVLHVCFVMHGSFP